MGCLRQAGPGPYRQDGFGLNPKIVCLGALAFYSSRCEVGRIFCQGQCYMEKALEENGLLTADAA